MGDNFHECGPGGSRDGPEAGAVADNISEDSTKEPVLASEVQKVLREGHLALQDWMTSTLAEHHRLLEEHGQSLKTLVKLLTLTSPTSLGQAQKVRSILSIHGMPGMCAVDPNAEPEDVLFEPCADDLGDEERRVRPSRARRSKTPVPAVLGGPGLCADDPGDEGCRDQPSSRCATPAAAVAAVCSTPSAAVAQVARGVKSVRGMFGLGVDDAGSPGQHIDDVQTVDATSSTFLDIPADDPSNPARCIDGPYTTGSTTGGMILDLRRSGRNAWAADHVPEQSPGNVSGEGEWVAVTPTAPEMPRSFHASRPGVTPVPLDCTVDALDTSEDFPHLFAPDGLQHLPTSTTHAESEESDHDEQHRNEWNMHLQRRVSQKINHKKMRRSVTLSDTVSSRVALMQTSSTWTIGEPRRLAWLRKKLRGLIQSTYFQWALTGVIMLNVVFIGYATDKGMQNVLADPMRADPSWFEAVNTAFTVWYCIELFVRAFAFGLDFFKNEDKKWNAFDTALVVLALVDEAVEDKGLGMGTMRVVRGVRMLRVLRIVSVMRYFPDLRLMVASILQCVGSLSWALMLLATIVYLFSVVFMQGATSYLLEEAEGGGRPSGVLMDGCRTWYSSVLQTMYTLLACIVNGVSWVPVVQPLEEVSLVYRWLFVFYVTFVLIGVLNVLTGIFVDCARELSGLDKDLVIQHQMVRDENFLEEMKTIFEDADADDSGAITWEEFKGYLENDRVKAYLSTQQLDAFDARLLFEILTEGDTELTLAQFIVGCQRLKGQARSVDLVAVLQETRAANKKLRAVMRHLDCGREGCVSAMPTSVRNSNRPASAGQLTRS